MRPLAVSMGDPAGIGLEIAGKAWRSQAVPPFCLIGDLAAAIALSGAPVQAVSRVSDALGVFAQALPVLPIGSAGPVRPGEPDRAHASAIIASIECGVAAALKGEAAALVTLPIAKAPLYEAGFRFPGHTEFVAELTKSAPMIGQRGPVMMLAGPSLKVALVTIHLPLRDVPEALTQARIIDTARVVAQALKGDFGIAQPRIALIGLNPHAGEGGALGREEIDIINPAAAALRAEGIDISDARPADASFHPEARAGYDAAIAMHHDQGLIPLKMLHFWEAVNLTLGLPIVRTSPDHGTGFDIAGKGMARPDSLIAALQLAADIAERRAR